MSSGAGTLLINRAGATPRANPAICKSSVAGVKFGSNGARGARVCPDVCASVRAPGDRADFANQF